MFNKKIEQFYDILRCRREYKNAKDNCIGLLWYITDTEFTKYRSVNQTHYDVGCIFRNIGITVDGQCIPDGIYEDYKEYCEFFDWNNVCPKKGCPYQGRNSEVIKAINGCEKIHEKLRLARRRFWGLEK